MIRVCGRCTVVVGLWGMKSEVPRRVTRPRVFPEFRRAVVAETAQAQDAYRRIIEHLAATVNYPHWHSENHPTPVEIEKWIADGDLYLAVQESSDGEGECRTESIIGVVVLDHDFANVDGPSPWRVEAEPHEVIAIHALGVVPEAQGKGVARFMVDSAIELARSRGCKAVRLDTYVENAPARALYGRYGFTQLGLYTVHYEGASVDQFHLFEYAL